MARAKKGVRKFTEWMYHDRDVKLKVPVHVHDQSGSSYIRDGEKPIMFFVKMDDPPVDIRHEDINELKAKVWAELKGKVSIEWKPHLLIIFSGSAQSLVEDKEKGVSDYRFRETQRTDIDLRVECCDLAELSNGQKYHRWTGRGYVGNTQDDWPWVGEAEESRGYTGRDNETRALIPDTPETRRALNKLITGFDALTANLKMMLAPALIGRSVHQLAQFGSLSHAATPALEYRAGDEAAHGRKTIEGKKK